jgi:hypothetical protein
MVMLQCRARSLIKIKPKIAQRVVFGSWNAPYLLRFTNMNYRANACRKKAGQFERAAKVATNCDACRVYLDVARQWRDRAEHTEELGRLTSDASKMGVTRANPLIANEQSGRIV